MRGRELKLDKTRVMGIVNVTPDSFSDGGRWYSTDKAIEHGIELARQGADILDVGGESSRPGAAPVPLDEELRRTIPVVMELARRTGLPISIDTYKGEVASRALAAGACVVNDITALSGDPAMSGVIAASGAGLVLMHMRGSPRDMQDNPVYENVVEEIVTMLRERHAIAVERGIAQSAIIIDPGIGFGKNVAHNLTLIASISRLAVIAPVMMGVSRKSFIGAITGATTDERLPGSLAAMLWSAAHGAAIVRVHDVGATRQALRVWAMLKEAGARGAFED